MPAASDFFPKIPRKAMPLANQHRPKHDLIVERMYLEAHHPATVLLNQGFSAPRQALPEAVLGNVADVLAGRLLGGHVLAVQALLVGLFGLFGELARDRSVIDDILGRTASRRDRSRSRDRRVFRARRAARALVGERVVFPV